MKLFNINDKSLYYWPVGSYTETTNQMTNNIDFIKFANSNPNCFRISAIHPDNNYEKKKIVFSSFDLLLNYASLDSNERLIGIVNKLLKNDFEIYIPTSNGLQQAKNYFELKQILKQLRIATKQTILDQAATQGFVADRTLVVDFNLLSDWLDNNDGFDLSLLKNLDEQNQLAIIDSFAQQNTSVKLPISEEYVGLFKLCVENGLRIYSLKLSETTCNSDTFEKFIKDLLTYLEDIKKVSITHTTIGDLTLDKTFTGKLSHIEELDLGCAQLSAANLATILSLCGDKLKKVTLNDTNITGDLDNSFTAKLSNIEELDLYCAQLSATTLAKILNLCGDKLKKVTLYDTNITGDLILDKTFTAKLSNIEELYLGHAQLSATTLATILSLCGDKLKKIHLSYANITGDLDNSFTAKLSNIEELYLGHAQLSATTLAAILSLCGDKLKKIHLSYANITGDLILGKTFTGKLSHIEELDLDSAQLSAANLATILSLCGDKLKKVTLYETNITGDLILGKTFTAKLSNIEELDLGYTQLSAANLTTILSLCGDKLKKVTLYETNITGDLDNSFTAKLSNIEELKLGYTQLSAANLTTILSLCGDKLKKVTLYDTNITGDLDNSFTAKLSNIEELNLGYTQLSATTLDKILSLCGGKLKKVTLNNANITGDLILGKTFTGKLSNIEELDLGCTQLSATTLAKILSLCGGKLKKVTLKRANITGDLTASKSLSVTLIKLAKTRSLSLDNLQCPNDPHLAIALNKIFIKPDSINGNPNTYIDGHHNSGRNIPGTCNNTQKSHAEAATTPDYQMDVCTEYDKKQTVNCQEYFKGLSDNAKEISSRRYRLVVMPEKETTPDVISYDPTKINKDQTDNKRIYYGSLNLTVFKDKWTYLPSIAPNEKLLAINYGNESNIELAYDQARNQYAVRLNDKVISYPRTIECYYLLAVPLPDNDVFNSSASEEKIHASLKSISDAESLVHAVEKLKTHNETDLIYCMQSYFSKFTAGELKNISANPNADDKLIAFISQRKGACRHRAWAFSQLANRLGIKCRMINNDRHSFVEVCKQNDTAWHSISLGGYPSHVNTIPMPKWPPRRTATNAHSSNDKNGTKPETNLTLAQIKSVIAASELHANYNLDQFTAETLRLYFQNKNKILIRVDSARFDDLAAKLHRELGNLFWLDSAEDLHDQAYGICIDNGKLKKTVGPLQAFLEDASKQSEQTYYLSINWSNFTSKELAGYQSILDDQGTLIDNMTIPSNVKIIGIIDSVKAQELREDFHSRHEHQLTLTGEIEPKPKTNDTVDAPYVIELYGSDRYEQLLTGRVRITDNGFDYIEGELIRAIKNNNKHIIIKNGPKNIRSFQLFQARIEQKQPLILQGKRYPLDDIKISFAYTENYEEISANIEISEDNGQWDQVLTAHNFSSCFNNFNVADDGSIQQQPGWIEQNRDGQLTLLIDAQFNLGHYAQLLHTAKRYNCGIRFCAYDKSLLPATLQQQVKSAQQEPAIPIAKNNSKIIQVADVYELVAEVDRLQKAEPNTLFIPVSDKMNFGDLIQTIANIDFEKAKISLRNSEVFKRLLDKDTKRVVLYGNLSSQVIKELESIWSQNSHLIVNGKKQEIAGELIWLTTNKELPSFLRKEQATDIITAESAPTQKSSTADIGEDLQIDVWCQKRRDMVKAAVAGNAITLLEGPTGSGKTFFVHNELSTLFPNSEVYTGIEKIADWANATNNSEKFLFIDEANLDREIDWYQFLGLYTDKPGIMIYGQYYPLSKYHKIIVAGNPASYEGRKLPQFLQEFPPNEVFFASAPESFIKEKVLPPCFSENDNAREDKIKIILETYKLLVQNGNLTTPRILQTLALLLAMHTAENLTTAAKLMSALGIGDMNKIDELPKPNCFLFRDCHRPILCAIDSLLQIRDYKIADNTGTRSSFGQRGLLLEGPSGIGKSSIVLKLLNEKGYEPANDKNISSNKRYYHISSENINSAFATIKRAAEEGAILMIDELNLLPIERELNAVLDSSYKKEGFMIIATQNKTNLPGRIPLSEALSSRLLKLELSDYDDNDYKAILANRYKTLPPETLKILVENRFTLFNQPTLRDLIYVSSMLNKTIPMEAL